MCITGEVQRRISSTAVGRSAASAASRARSVGVLAEGEHAAGDRIAGRLVAGEDEQVAEVEDLLIGQRFAIDAPRP